MQRFTGTEIAAIFFAAFLCVGGLALVLKPKIGIVYHFTNDGWGQSPGYLNHDASKLEIRFYGTGALLAGVIIGAMALYREK
jgi:hypothetical protein